MPDNSGATNNITSQNAKDGASVESKSTQLAQQSAAQQSERATQTDNSSTASTGVKENIAKGILGALLGSLGGCIAIIVLDRLGFVAAISGVIMAVGTLRMYEMFAKGLSGKGIAICIVVMVVMTLLAENIAISISVVEELATDYDIDVSFWGVFSHFYKLLADGIIDWGVYAGSLALVYLFNVLGAFSIIKTSLGKKKAA